MKQIFFISILFFSGMLHAQLITTVAGTGVQGSAAGPFVGDANSVNLNKPTDIEVDANGNLYFCDQFSHVVIKLDVLTNQLSVICGTGISGSGSFSQLGPNFALTNPSHLYLDDAEEFLYITTSGDNRIIKMNLSDSTMHHVAGNGSQGYVSDGNLALSSPLSVPMSVVKASDGTVYFVENGADIVRKINSDGTLWTVAGYANAEGDVDGTGTAARLNSPYGLTIDENNVLYVTDALIGKIKMIEPITTTVTTIAGTGIPGYSGDGGAAILAQFNLPQRIFYDGDGRLLIPDNENARVRVMDINTNQVWAIAGNGIEGYSGDGGNPLTAQINQPLGVCSDLLGNVYFTDYDNFVVRKITTCTPPSIPDIQVIMGTPGADSTYCEGPMTIQVVNGDLNDATEWVWYENSCGGNALAAGGTLNYLFNETVTLSVRGEGACVNEGPCQKITLTLGDCDTPGIDAEEITAFSPNNDGVNDKFFIPMAEHHPTNNVSIFNRWGDEIRFFENYDNLEQSWDGRDEFGVWVGVGTYFYIFESGNIKRQGWVNVVK